MSITNSEVLKEFDVEEDEFVEFYGQMDLGYNASDFYIFPDVSFEPLLAEKGLLPLPEYVENELISTGLPVSVTPDWC